MINPSDTQLQLVLALQNPGCYKHPVERIRHLETHISHLLLTGPYAYKIKKPVNLGFLDFSTLEKRQFYCEEEIRLNKRLAPKDYLAVVAITGSPENPQVEGYGPVLDYAVKMRQFDPASTLDRLDDQGQLTVPHVDAIASALTDFHGTATVAPADSNWGIAEAVWAPMEQNFTQLAARIEGEKAKSLLEALRLWSQVEHGRLAGEFERRRIGGFIRECHGDLHLGNMAWREGELLIFDCLEFNADLRWIDVMSEVAFCYTDLLQRGHRDFAARFLNHYLERTGDFAGVTLLRFYTVYRAMVRAKVAYIRAHQSDQTADEANKQKQAGLSYLRFARDQARSETARLVITHGLSGSGKTTFTQQLLEKLGAIRLRSDVERKRLAGLDALARTSSEAEKGIYGQDFSKLTYDHLATLAEGLLKAGWDVIIDATFIACWQRKRLFQVAAKCAVTFHILDFSLPAEILRERVIARSLAGDDASEADLSVLEHQLKTREPLTQEESQAVIVATSVEAVCSRIGLK